MANDLNPHYEPDDLQHQSGGDHQARRAETDSGCIHPYCEPQGHGGPASSSELRKVDGGNPPLSPRW